MFFVAYSLGISGPCFFACMRLSCINRVNFVQDPNEQRNVIAQLNVIEERLERLSVLEDSTDEIKADLAELKGMRAEMQSLKELVEGKK